VQACKTTGYLGSLEVRELMILLLQVIKGYETREQQLLEENASMRSALAVLEKELVDTLNQASAEVSTPYSCLLYTFCQLC
jgi:hypothetical protein